MLQTLGLLARLSNRRPSEIYDPHNEVLWGWGAVEFDLRCFHALQVALGEADEGPYRGNHGHSYGQCKTRLDSLYQRYNL